MWNTVRVYNKTWLEGLRHSAAGALNAQIYMYFLKVRLQLLSTLQFVKCPSFLRTGECNECSHSAQITNVRVDLATRRGFYTFVSFSTKWSTNMFKLKRKTELIQFLLPLFLRSIQFLRVNLIVLRTSIYVTFSPSLCYKSLLGTVKPSTWDPYRHKTCPKLRGLAVTHRQPFQGNIY